MQKKSTETYKNILVIIVGFSILALILKLDLMLKITLLVGVVALLIPKAAKALEWLWLKFALVLGWINSRILLSIVYYLFLFPISILSKIFTKDPLALRTKGRTSLYVERNHTYTSDDLKNIW